MDNQVDRVRAVRDRRYKYLYNYYPELPYVQDIRYRKQIPMMSVLYEYDSLGKFQGNQALWWRKTKPREELYDTETDPFEFNNLADDPRYTDKLEELRSALKEWQQEFGDKCLEPETEMISHWWEGKDHAPETEVVNGRPDGNMLVLSCSTQGASIAWQYVSEPPDGHWNLYTEPIEMKDRLIRAVADRIGYQASETKEFGPSP